MSINISNHQEVQQLLKLSKPGADADSWLIGAESSIDFLKKNASESADRIVLYASLPNVFIHAVLAPLRQLKPPDQSKLEQSFAALDTSWRIEHTSGGGRRDRVYLSPPLSQDSTNLKGGENLIFRRSWPGEDRASNEISQKLEHALNLHYVSERNAYCRINEHGDMEDIIKISDLPNEQRYESVTVITIKRQDLYKYVTLAKMGLVFFFRFARYPHQGYDTDWFDQEHFECSDPLLSYKGGVKRGLGSCSYVQGCQIVFSPVTKNKIVRCYEQLRNPRNEKYVKFNVQDPKTKKFIEVSCDPTKLPSHLSELSLVFFRLEAINRFKADPEKYELANRSLSCRDAWHLQTFDYNEDGCIHLYLCDLATLPYQEQLYWQSFNETPQGARPSRESIFNDLLCQKGPDYDPLSEIKQKIEDLNKQPPAWWTPRGADMAGLVHCPITPSKEGWSEAFLRLDHLLIEGFSGGELKKMAVKMGRPQENGWGSLKLMEECLIGRGLTEEQAKEAMEPLRELHHLRTLKAHAMPDKKEDKAKQALKAHGSFKSHFETLVAGCDKALGLIVETLGSNGK